MIINIGVGSFGGPMRMGDIIACANVVAHFRQTANNSNIKFYLTPGSIQSSNYVQEFKSWMLTNTDYFSPKPGTDTLSWYMVNPWDYRDISGDLVCLPNNKSTTKKVVVAPLQDADYNVYRNWPSEVVENIFNKIENTYKDYDLVIASKNPFTRRGWRNSVNLVDVLDEIMTAEIYIGGDTGLSHFVGALQSGPEPIYYYSSRGLLHTTPFNWHTNKKGTMKTYWLDFENSRW